MIKSKGNEHIAFITSVKDLFYFSTINDKMCIIKSINFSACISRETIC